MRGVGGVIIEPSTQRSQGSLLLMAVGMTVHFLTSVWSPWTSAVCALNCVSHATLALGLLHHVKYLLLPTQTLLYAAVIVWSELGGPDDKMKWVAAAVAVWHWAVMLPRHWRQREEMRARRE